MSHTRPSVSRIVATLGIAGAVTAASVTAATDAGAEATATEAGGMTLVDVHDAAAAQPTTKGRQLLELEVVDGKVYAGYGDYGANTGPITLAAYDPATEAGFEDQFTVDTEAVYNIRDLGGDVVAPATDPRSTADYAMSGPWHEARPFGATHTFDSATLTGEDRWMVGSKGNDAVAWRSLDGGQTWHESLRIAPSSGISGDFNRFYFAGVAGGELYVQAVGAKSYDAPTSMVFDGATWREGPDLLPTGGFGWDAEPFGDGFVLHTSGHGWAGGVVHFDGQTASQVASNVIDVTVADGAVWALQSDGVIARSTDLGTWDSVLVAPTSARSLAVDAGSVYVGTSDSALWQASLPDEPTPEVLDGTTATTEPDSTEKITGPSDEPGEKGNRKADDTDGTTGSRCPKGWAKKGRC